MGRLVPAHNHGSETVLRGRVWYGDLVLLSASGSWFGAGEFVYFRQELLLMMGISKYIVSE
jgi:hypothetical protein